MKIEKKMKVIFDRVIDKMKNMIIIDNLCFGGKISRLMK